MKQTNRIVMLASLLVISAFTSCVKENPTADFTIDVSSPNEGQIDLKNTSVGATSYSWDFGDGTKSTNESPSHTYAKNGSYTIKLIARSASGGTDSKSQSINIQDVQGSAVFWTNANGPSEISVYVNNVFKGKITSYYSSSTPTCGQSGCVTVRLPEGTYTFKANDSGGNWNGNIKFISGQCVSQKLSQ